MSRFGTVAAVALVATVALASRANAMPSFVRQTGLTCMQCHVTVIGTPDFTFTGKKFRLNGYRSPWVGEKIEAGEEGALNGRRLALSNFSPFSMRIGQSFLSQSKGSQEVGSPNPDPSAVTSTPFSNWAMFYVGSIGDHVGFWNETYFTARGNTSQGSQTYRFMGMDEWDLKLVFNPGYDNIIGFATTTQTFSYLAGFGAANSGAALNAMQRGGTPGSAHTPYGNIGVYGMLKDKLLFAAGVQGGEDNYSLKGMAYLLDLGLAVSNSDYNQFWVNFQGKFGNDGVPIVTNTSLSGDVTSYTYSDAYNGVSATRGGTSATRVAYRSSDIGDFIRTKTEAEYSFTDKGPHRLWTSCGFVYNKETYADGAKIDQQGWGCTIRYLNNQTYGISYSLSGALKNDFTDRNAVVHKISDSPINPLSFGFHYKVAQNFRAQLSLSGLTKGGGGRLDDTRSFKANGWSWGISFDFQF
jgi:hypothetical protein